MMSFGYGLMGFAVFVVMAPAMQLIARRAALSVPPVAILAIAALVSHFACVLLGAATLQQFQYWDAASVFGFGVMIYVFAFGAVYKSVSLELLLGLAQRPGRGVSLSHIIDRQVPDIFRGRTEILVAGGLAERIGPSFVATAAGLKLAGRIAGIRRAFAIGDTGLYEFTAPVSPPDKTREL
jgi:hypothetical protein